MFHVKHITGIFRGLENGMNPRWDGDFRFFEGIVRVSTGRAHNVRSAVFGVARKWLHCQPAPAAYCASNRTSLAVGKRVDNRVDNFWG
jgi:hypothetical protein